MNHSFLVGSVSSVRAGNVPLPPEGGYVKYEPHRGWWGTTPDGRIITGFKEKPSDALRDLSARVHFEHFRP